MVSMRGGSKGLGPYGFMETLLMKCVYNPMYRFASGPMVQSIEVAQQAS